MPLSGDGQDKLRGLIQGFQELASKRYLRQMNQSLGAEMLSLVKGGFDQSADPYGKAWAPVRRGGLPLRKTGRLRNAWTFTGSDSRLELENGLIYANMMQHGTAGLPGGKLTPKNAKALSFDVPGLKKRRGSSWQPTITVKSVVIAARKMVPDDGDLPDAWETRMRATAENVMQLLLKAQGA